MNSHHPAILGVIGAGRVGRAVTAAVVTTDLVSNILVHSRQRLESTALATDASDLAATQHVPILIDAVEHPRDLRDATLLIVCVRARFTNHTQDRRGGLLPNAPLVADLAHQLHGFPGPVVMVSNPVDVMSRVFAEHSDTAVLGVGSNLDSARYRTLVAHHLAVPLTAVSGSVLGEHGETAAICEHATRVHQNPVPLPWASSDNNCVKDPRASQPEWTGRSTAPPVPCCQPSASCSDSPRVTRNSPLPAPVACTSGNGCGSSPAGTGTTRPNTPPLN